MTSFKHDQIARSINALEEPSETTYSHSSWLKAQGHLDILRRNASDDEVILYANTRTTFIHAVITKESDVITPNYDDLLKWTSSPYTGRAGYSWTPETGIVQMSFSATNPSPQTMKHSQNLVFGRKLEDLNEPYQFQLLQEFEHATNILWRAEHRAYCRIDEKRRFRTGSLHHKSRCPPKDNPHYVQTGTPRAVSGGNKQHPYTFF